MEENTSALKLFLSDNITKYSLITSFLLIFVNSLIVIITQRNLPPVIPLFNSLPWGTDRLFPAYGAFFFPLSCIAIFLCNAGIGSILYKKYALISRLLTLNVLLYVLIGFIAYIQILLLVY